MPDFVPARFLLGAALMAQGNSTRPSRIWRASLHMAPDNLEARKLLAQVRLRMGQPDAALELLSPLQADADADVNTLIGLAHLQLGNRARRSRNSSRPRRATAPTGRGSWSSRLATCRRAPYRKAVVLLRGLPHVDGDARRETLLIAAVAGADGLEASDAEMTGLLEAHPEGPGAAQCREPVPRAARRIRTRARLVGPRARRCSPTDTATLLNSARIEAAGGDGATAAARLQGILTDHPDHVAARMGLAQLALQRQRPARRRGGARTAAGAGREGPRVRAWRWHVSTCSTGAPRTRRA